MALHARRADVEKMRISLRYWLLGREYYQALEAMEFAARWHTGTRKDGSHEFGHQLRQALYLRSIERLLIDPQSCLVVCFLHDVVEDKPVSLADINTHFGPAITASVDAISKEVGGVRKTDTAYFAGIAADPVASICKGADRIDNQDTMVGAFTAEKQLSYIRETEQFLLPMLKTARRTFFRQDPAYENVKSILIGQVTLVRALQQSVSMPA